MQKLINDVLNDKEKDINELKKMKCSMEIKLKKQSNEIDELKSKKNLGKIKNENLITVIITTEEENIICSLIVKKTNLLKEIEDLFCTKYPQYKKTKNYFYLNGKLIEKNKTLKENNIKNNDIITLKIYNPNSK